MPLNSIIYHFSAEHSSIKIFDIHQYSMVREI